MSGGFRLMAVLALRDGSIWGASRATLTMLLRYAAIDAPPTARACIDEVLAANGVGLDLARLDDAEVVEELEQALLDGAQRMQASLGKMIELADQLEAQLVRSVAPIRGWDRDDRATGRACT